MFLSGGLHAADPGTEVPGAGQLHGHRLVSLLASAGPAVGQLQLHREDTGPGGDSTLYVHASTPSSSHTLLFNFHFIFHFILDIY